MSTPPENSDSTSPDCPWAAHPATGEQERISPPAPVIEVDGPDLQAPVKPLGPRRLARLQREMAEHARQLQEAEQHSGVGEVDDALLAQQRRLAELAVRAAAASEQDRADADRSAASSTATDPVRPTDGPAGVAEGEHLTITFPGLGAGQESEEDVRFSDPASLPSSPVHYGPVTATTQIPLTVGPGPEPTAGATVSEPATERADQDATSSDTPELVQDAEPAPASPVRAVDAEGLELLEPKAYTRGASGTRVLLGLLLVVIAALAVALIMFVL